jgi:hypothetical protein
MKPHTSKAAIVAEVILGSTAARVLFSTNEFSNEIADGACSMTVMSLVQATIATSDMIARIVFLIVVIS